MAGLHHHRYQRVLASAGMITQHQQAAARAHLAEVKECLDLAAVGADLILVQNQLAGQAGGDCWACIWICGSALLRLLLR